MVEAGLVPGQARHLGPGKDIRRHQLCRKHGRRFRELRRHQFRQDWAGGFHSRFCSVFHPAGILQVPYPVSVLAGGCKNFVAIPAFRFRADEDFGVLEG
ncbi:MAG: hypothetical protein EBT77_07415, partial [Verrucomicrobia bacterium]|nr:hypothetical protein [Verrucomicrobiota bacterium]